MRENGFVITSAQDEPGVPEGQFDGLLDMAAFLKIGGAFSIEDAVPEAATAEYFEPEIAEYDSVDAFLAAEDMTILVPDRDLLGRDFGRERNTAAAAQPLAMRTLRLWRCILRWCSSSRTPSALTRSMRRHGS